MKEHTIIQTESALKDYVSKVGELLAFDTESTSLDRDAYLLGISLFDNVQPACYIVVDTPYFDGVPLPIIQKHLNPVFRRSRGIAHNAKYDLGVLQYNGFDDITLYADTALAAHVYNPDLLKKLETRVKEDLKIKKPTYEEIIGKKWRRVNWLKDTESGLINIEELGKYACEDAYYTMKLWEFYEPKLKKDNLLDILFKIEVPLCYVLRDMKNAGVLIDVDYLKAMDVQIDEEIASTVKRIYELAGCEFNLNSPKQKAEVLFDVLKLPVQGKTKTGNPATDKGALDELAKGGHEIAVQLISFSSLNKLSSGYVKAIPKLIHKDGRLRCEFNSAGARTGRMSANSPNLQNQPNNAKFPVRQSFIAKPGYKFLVLDWSQVELRVMAHASKDKRMTEAFLADEDIHGLVAKDLGIKRSQAKCVHPDSWLATSTGLKRIGCLSTNREKDTFENISDFDAATGSRITSFYSNGEGERVLLISKRNILVCSKKHQVQTVSHGLIQAAKIIPGKHALVDKEIPSAIRCKVPDQYLKYNPYSEKGEKIARIHLDENWAYFAGAFMGDGCHNKKCVVLSASDKEAAWTSSLLDSCKKVGITLKRSSKHRFSKGSTAYIRLLKELSLISDTGKTFRVPEWVLGNHRLCKWFLAGLIDTDGTVNKGGTVCFTTKDVMLAHDMVMLMKVCNYSYGVEVCYNKTYERDYYRMHIYRASLDEFYADAPLRHPRKNRLLRERLTIKGNVTPLKENKVSRAVPFDKGPLVDITVDNDEHLYWCNGLITHNTVNFGVLYGMGPNKLSDTLEIPIEKAKAVVHQYEATYKGYAHWKKWVENYAKNNLYVKNIYGRIRRLPDVANTRDSSKHFAALRQSVNTIIQGTAADLMKIAMIRLHEKFKGVDAELLMVVHDEVIVEVREDIAQEIYDVTLYEMENIAKLRVPLKADGKICTHWAEMKDASFTGEAPTLKALDLLLLDLI